MEIPKFAKMLWAAFESSDALNRPKHAQVEALGSLPEFLKAHGFSYAGFVSSSDHMRGTEDHYFFSGRCTLVFCFPYSMYGDQSFLIADPSSSHCNVSGIANLSLYVPDLHSTYFSSLRVDGGEEWEFDSTKSKGDALVEALTGQLELAIQLFQAVRAEGRLLPLRADWARVKA